MSLERLKGSIPPLVTPFRSGAVDYDAYAKIVAFHIEHGSHGILVNGTTAEPATLSVEERNRLVDVAVHFVKARGTVAKVFKLRRLVLPARGTVELETSFSLAVHTTRVPRPGRHEVEVLVNGEAKPAGAFQVVARRRA